MTKGSTVVKVGEHRDTTAENTHGAESMHLWIEAENCRKKELHTCVDSGVRYTGCWKSFMLVAVHTA